MTPSPSFLPLPATPRVYVVKFSDRRAYQLQWLDPYTNRKRTESARTANRRKAYDLASEKEKELAEEIARRHNPAQFSQHPADGSLPFLTLVSTFLEEHMSSLSPASRTEFCGTVNHLTRILNPLITADLNSQSLSSFVAARRAAGIAETTIAKDLRYIGQLLRWAVSTSRLRPDLLPNLPRLRTTRRSGPDDEMKGRPLTDAECEHLLASIATLPDMTPERAPSLRNFIHGLTLSGLRLSEAIQLRFDRGPWISLDLSTSHGALIIPGKQKSRRHETSPIAPDFCTFARETLAPIARAMSPASSYVFNVLGKSGSRLNNEFDISRLVSSLGKHAGIITDPATNQHATAHDLRRTFGARWAVRVVPVVLKSLMRHASISTTMRYYVGANLERTQEAIYKAFASEKSGLAESNSSANSSSANSNDSQKSPENKG